VGVVGMVDMGVSMMQMMTMMGSIDAMGVTRCISSGGGSSILSSRLGVSIGS